MNIVICFVYQATIAMSNAWDIGRLNEKQNINVAVILYSCTIMKIVFRLDYHIWIVNLPLYKNTVIPCMQSTVTLIRPMMIVLNERLIARRKSYVFSFSRSMELIKGYGFHIRHM